MAQKRSGRLRDGRRAYYDGATTKDRDEANPWKTSVDIGFGANTYAKDFDEGWDEEAATYEKDKADEANKPDTRTFQLVDGCQPKEGQFYSFERGSMHKHYTDDDLDDSTMEVWEEI